MFCEEISDEKVKKNRFFRFFRFTYYKEGKRGGGCWVEPTLTYNLSILVLDLEIRGVWSTRAWLSHPMLVLGKERGLRPKERGLKPKERGLKPKERA
jgi:hypothetical protein